MSEDFEEEENHNVIIDCDILEAAKENIQPLAGGRRVTALASVLATPHGLRDARLEATKGRLRERVREAQARVDKLKALKEQEDKEVNKEDDAKVNGDEEDEEFTLEEAEEALLDIYVRLVTWTVEHYPRGQSAASGILEQLEEATRVLRHSDFAKADARYLNLWIRYGCYVDHPEVIYEFLLANEIGTKWAKLYEEYSTLLEKINRRSKADEIYLLGIARKAEPLDRLERRHREFQKRMMVSTPILGSESPSVEPTPTPASSFAEPRRRILGESTSTSTTSSASTPLTATSSHRDVLAAPSSSSSLASFGSQGRPRTNGRIPVFVDPTGDAESAPGNAWPELGTRAERVKENTRAPEKMQGAVLKQRGAAKAATREAGARARAAPKIVPFKDPELSGAGSGSRTKIVPFRDPEPPASAPGSRTATKIVPFKDPEPPSAASDSRTKIVPFKDPEPPANTTGARSTSKIVPFRDPVPVAPRRSSRLGSKTPAKSSFEPLVETAEDDVPVTTKPGLGTTARFVPFRDEDVALAPTATSSVPEAVMRPKTIGSSGLGVPGATSEAEALRKDPFKNYKDL